MASSQSNKRTMDESGTEALIQLLAAHNRRDLMRSIETLTFYTYLSFPAPITNQKKTMSQEPPSHQPNIASARDLTDLCEVKDYETRAVLRTTFTFVDAHHTVWFGQLVGVRKYNIPIERLRESLQRVPDETVYPPITPGLTIIPGDSDVAGYYIKRPKFLCLDDAEETKMLPKMLAEEAAVLESLKQHPHRNLVKYHGCVGARGRIVGLAVEKHEVILQYRFEDDPRDLDVPA
jgi:hypothetical protein